MKERKLYYRRKENSIIIEGKADGKSILIWTLPDPEKLLEGIEENSSFFTQEKWEKILEKLERLDIRSHKKSKGSPKVPSIIINRSLEKDAGIPSSEDIEKSLSEIGKI